MMYFMLANKRREGVKVRPSDRQTATEKMNSGKTNEAHRISFGEKRGNSS